MSFLSPSCCYALGNSIPNLALKQELGYKVAQVSFPDSAISLFTLPQTPAINIYPLRIPISVKNCLILRPVEIRTI